MFNHTINPTLLSLGPLEIRFYGIVYALGFILLILWLFWARKKGKLPLKKEDIYDLVLYLILGLVIGARLFHVFFWEPVYYITHWWEIGMIWKGGMSFHGGLLGTILAGFIFARKKKLNFWQLADLVVIPAVFALALGRIANFINGELVGTPTNVSWCVNFPGESECRHPVQLYDSLKRFFIFGILAYFLTKKTRPGFIFWVMMTLFGIGRFFLDFLREDPRWFGLSLGQYLSLLMFVIGLGVLLLQYKKDLKKIF